MDTALVLVVPEAEPTVRSWRERFDPAASEGVPAHITLMYPFRFWAKLDEASHFALSDLFGGYKPFDLLFRSTGRFPGVLWLAPEPTPPVVALVQAIMHCFPDCRPYGGIYPDIVPHLTIADVRRSSSDEIVLDQIAQEFATQSASRLPIHSRVTEVTLLRRVGGLWSAQRRYRLAG
jgi:2'-5' RNA ligase